MPPYEVELAPRAQNDLRDLSTRILKRVLACLDGLREQPRGRNSIKLKGYANQYRARVGDYRIVYEIDDKRSIIDVVAIRHRSECYR
jgi:mRNA interferase RelE/StbE